MTYNRLLPNWTAEEAAASQNSIFVGQHQMAELELFNDDLLATLLDNHPRSDLGVNTMGLDPKRRDEWQEGEPGTLSGKELLTAVQRGRLWLNVRRVMDHHTEYAELVNQLYGELEEHCKGLTTFNRSANLLISSPQAIVYYHLDCPVNMLWHLRGTKTVWAYPLESGIVAPEVIEDVLCGNSPEELEYRQELDRVAVVRDLKPGQLVTWPQHTPHRVVNTGGVNVSLSTEHFTREALRKNNVHLANRHFRSLFPWGFHDTETQGPLPAAKEFALRVAKRLPVMSPDVPQGYEYPKSFVVDLNAPNCVRSLDEEPSGTEAVPLDFSSLDVSSPVSEASL